MKRRRYLLAVAGTAGALTGCLGQGGGGSTPSGSDGQSGADGGGSPSPGSGSPPPSSYDVELPVPKGDLVRGAPKDGIPAITDPAFGSDWSDTDFALSDDDEVIGLTRDGTARAYPIRVLDYHEIVNDELGGPLLVTYCPLCGSGMTAVRTVRGEETVFGVSGYLYRADLVMYDERTNSLWSQIMATAINGDLTGDTLTLVPSSLTTWGAWRDDHPDTEVLLPPPASGTITDARPRSYDVAAYAGYENTRRIGIGYSSFDDDRLHPKAQVIGVSTDEAAKAYPFGAVADAGVLNDRVGEIPVVVATGPEETLYAYDRRVDGETLSFERSGNRLVGGGSEWTITTGEAVSGPHEGERLDTATGGTRMFWFAWLEFNPETTLYGE